MNKLLNFGSLNIDYTYLVDHFLLPGETLSSLELTTNMGGKGLNQSVAASRAGAAVYHAGLVGKDGRPLLDFLIANDVNVEFVDSIEGVSGHAIVEVDQSGQNRILIHAGANCKLTEQKIDAALAGFSKGDILLVQNEVNLVGEIIKKASQRGMRIAFNPSPCTQMIKNFPIELVEWLILNEIEGQMLSGESDPARIISALCAKYPSTKLVLTLGSAGVLFYSNGKLLEQSAFTAPVVDTTAAGDTFTGYFLAGQMNGSGDAESLRIASKAAAITVSRKGAAVSIPRLTQVR